MSCRGFGVLIALAAVLGAAACGTAGTGQDAPDDVLPEVASDVPAPPDAVDAPDPSPDAADAPPDASPDVSPAALPACPPAGDPVPSGGLVPEPWRFHDLGAAVPLAGVSTAGASADEADEVRAIASRAGVPLLDAGGWPVRFLDAFRWADLVAACGFPADLPAGSYYLRVGPEGADVAAPDDDGRFHALKTLKQLVEPGQSKVRAAAVPDRPATAIRGVGESYYGEPWARDVRLAMIPILADLKFDYYMYAPKFDMAIAAFWAYPFPDEQLAQFRELADVAKANRIHACIQMHPQGVRFSDPVDYEAVMAKYDAAAAAGFECFVLAFDDMDKTLLPEDQSTYATFTEGQVDWANRVGAALRQAHPDALLGFVPNDYWSGASGVQTDLAYVGEHLDPAWDIAWTGPEVGSSSITAADADAIASVLRRKPFLADNHPVVDNTALSGIMNLAPLEQRAPDLPGRVTGMIYNPMPVAYASLSGLATAGDYAWNAEAYGPSRSLAAVARWLAGPDAAPAVETLCRANYSPYSNPSPAPALEGPLDAFWAEHAARAPGSAEGPAAAALRQFLATYAAVPAGLAKARDGIPGFVADVTPWADKLGALGDAALLAMDLLAARAAGQAVDPADLAGLKARRDAQAQAVAKPTGKLLPAFLDRAIAEIEGAAGSP